jgi:asparagine synthase (glutamine-hydrolysing)
MRQALAFAESGDETRAGAFHLLTNAWMNPEHKDVMCTSAMLESSDSDVELAGWYQRVYERARASCNDPVQAHLLFHQRVNLTNLLRRLDARTMRHGVEGRTPFADLEVARFANAIPMGSKFVGSDPALTKQCLRETFAADLPESIVSRPKASFPMPFERWVSSMAPVLLSSEIAREWFTESAIELVARDATRHWNLAWPMLNLVLWGERMYGDRGLARRVLDEQAAVPA